MFGCKLQILQVKIGSSCHICEWSYEADLMNKSEIKFFTVTSYW